jgi:glycosyltransferase involved in cell wall biosynthesis
VKGHSEMLDIFARIVAAVPAARLVLVGDGPTRQEMENKAATSGLAEKVSFLGQRSDIPELVSCFDVLALPSRSEGLPIAAIEAMAAGRVVVAFRVGGVGDIVQDDKTGCLAAPGDVSAFAAAVVSLLNDPERRRAFSARALEVSRSFGIPEHVRQLSALYGKLADPRFRDGSLH